MNNFYPFIYEKKNKRKEKFEPLPLYVELGPEPKKNDENKDEDPSIIIIEVI